MESYQVIFNGVPLPRPNYFCEQVYLPKQVIFQVNEYKNLFDKIDEYILKTGIVFSSYEVNFVW